MTKTGIGFLVLNLLLALLFLAVVSPVMRKRAATQSAIAASATAKDGLLKDIDEADRKRRLLLAEAAVVQSGHQRLQSNHRMVVSELQVRAAEVADHLNDSKSRLANLKGTLAQAENEINARDAELLEITAEIERLRVFGTKLDEDNGELEKQLAAARKEAADLNAAAVAGHERMSKLAERFAAPADDGQ